MSNNRPHGRKRGETTASGDVHKRDQAEDVKGSVKDKPEPRPQSRPQNTQNTQRNTGYGRQNIGVTPVVRGVTRRGGGSFLTRIILFLLIAFLLYSCLMNGMSSQTAANQPAPTATAKPTPTPAQTAQPTPTPKPSVKPSGSFATAFQQPTTSYNHNTSTSTVDTSVATGAREKYTKIKGNGQDQVTVMIYMIATDLESNYAMGSNDLNEMLYADTSDKVNIVVECGGTRRWQNNVLSNRTNQRIQVKGNSLYWLDRNVGMKQMTDPNTLVDFINFSTKNFPADRYMLILWDHGSGSVMGYGHDENYPNSTMTLDELYKALGSVGVKFDFVGFDACLMGNTETAVAVSPYADYLIASEETEPGTGWYYTNWLSSLAKNSSIPTTELGKQIIDDFIKDSASKSPRDKTSLSLIDLAEFSATVPAKLKPFAQQITQNIQSDNYRAVANARSVTKEFAQSNRLDQVDLVHFCQNINTNASKELADAVQKCVKYNRTNNMNNAYGLSIYFPYYSAKYVNAATQINKTIGMDDDYSSAIRSFATMSSSGQAVNNYTSSSLFDLLGGGQASSQTNNVNTLTAEDIMSLLLGGGTTTSQQQQPQTNYYNNNSYYGYGNSYGGYPSASQDNSLSNLLGGSGGIDQQTLELFSSLFFRSHVDTDQLVYSERDGQTVLALDEDQWKNIQYIKQNVWVKDDTGYIDLGQDNIFEFDDDGNLIIDYDGRWVCLDNQPVAYYMISDEYESDDEYVTTGFVPAMVTHDVLYYDENDAEQHETVTDQMNIIIEYSDENPDGIVLGGQFVYDEETEAKGLYQFQAGDQIDFLCDYYDTNGNFQHAYYLSEPITVGDTLKVGVYQIEGMEMLYSYCLTDIYNAVHWTPVVTYK